MIRSLPSTFLHFIFIGIFMASASNMFAQWNALGPSDVSQPSLSKASNASLSGDASGNLYTAFIDEGVSTTAHYIMVRKYSGGNWTTIASLGYQAKYLSLVVNPFDNLPYIIFQDVTAGRKASLLKYNGSNWLPVGNTGFSVGVADSISLAFDHSGNPYVAYEDASNRYAATVMKFSNGTWNLLGSAGFTTNTVNNLSLAIDKNDVPFIAYRDGNTNNGIMMQFIGGAWVTVGNTPFSNELSGDVSIDIDQSNNVNVAFINLNLTCNVRKFNGTAWVDVGPQGFFGTSPGSQIKLKMDANNIPYVLFENSDAKPMVINYSGGTWTAVGGSYVPCDGFINSLSIVFDLNNKCTVCYIDHLGYDKVFVQQLNGNQWSLIGSPGISGGSKGDYTNISTDLSGVPYILYAASNSGQQAVLKNYVSNSWNLVSQGFTSSGIANPVLVMDNLGNPIAVYVDVVNNSKLSAKKYINGAWTNLGNLAFSPGTVVQPKVAVNTSGSPFVAFVDIPSHKATVMSFSNNTWNIVGTAGFSAGTIISPSIIIDQSGKPVVAYTDQSASSHITAMRFDGTNWVSLGSMGFSAGEGYSPTLATDPAGNIYIAYQDGSQGYKVTVQKYSNGSWNTVGNSAVSPGIAQDNLSLVFDAAGTPYVAFQDWDASKKISVKKLTGSNWTFVGQQGFSAAEANYPSMVYKNNKLFVTYSTGLVFADSFDLSGSLPISFLKINASKHGNYIQVNWKVADPLDCKQYVIQRSGNGIDFIDIGSLNGTSIEEYVYQDLNPGNGQNFYRIKSISNSDQFLYSDIIKISLENLVGNISVYPNPARENRININLKNQPSGNYKIDLSNTLGEQIYSETLNNNGVTGNFQIKLPAGVANGIYHLKITSPDHTSQSKVLLIDNGK